MPQPDYGPLDRTLHRIALGPRFVREAAFELQEAVLSRKPQPPVEQPVFIAGLARSGSTMLLNTLHGSGAFRSLTYRDMPFVMMPGVWHSLSRATHAKGSEKERAHGDRLLVDYDSPEAFEEVFWRTFCADQYIVQERLVPHSPGPATRRKFATFVRHVLASSTEPGQARYLAKNNNNLLRLGSLKQTFDDAHILVPFREPVQHAMSLLRQHELFCASHAQDKFGMQYMQWLGHWEFGLAHRHYAYLEEPNPYAPEGIDYWLRSWFDAYTHALACAPPDAIFLGYESLCEEPRAFLSRLVSRLGVDYDIGEAAARYQRADSHGTSECDEELASACAELYQRLVARSEELLTRS